MKKTNNVVLAYKLQFPNRYAISQLETIFSNSNRKKNIYEFDNSNYSGCLEYLCKEGYGFFFKFDKIRNKNIKASDLNNNAIEIPNALPKGHKMTFNSYFVYYPDVNIVLSLYNNEAMRHVSAPLIEYFKKHTSTDIFCEPIPLEKTADEFLKNTKYVNRIEVHFAKKNIDKTEENIFGRLSKYSEPTEIIIFNRLGKKPVDIIKEDILKIVKTKDIKKLIVKGNNLNEDIIKELMWSVPCLVSSDNNDYADFDDFKEKVNEIYIENKEFLRNYSSKS